MLILLLHVVVMSGFGLLLQQAKNHGHRLNPIGFVNYFTALLVSLWSAALAGGLGATRMTSVLGFANGVTYAIGFVLFTAALTVGGVVVSTATVRLAMVVPIVAALFIWKEIPNGWQTLGILLANASLPLLAAQMSPDSDLPTAPAFAPPTGGSRRERGRVGLALLILVLLFLNAGLSRLTMKAFNELCPPGDKQVYLVWIFAVSTLTYLAVCLRQRLLPSRWEVLYGALIGLCNVGGSGLFLVALDRVPALIAFPVSGAGGLIFTTLVGVLLLKERLRPKTLVGVLVGTVALVMVNLQR